MDSYFEPCVACLKVQARPFMTVHVRCIGYIWMEPPEEDGSVSHMPRLLIYVWAVGGLC